MDFTTIIWAVVVLGALAIVFGLILAVAAKVFEVEVDPRLPEIQACLAGANCGGCGYPGCAGCAEAILAGKAPVTACAPAGAEGAAKIAAIMGMEAPSGEKMVAHVLCNGGTNAVKNFEYRGVQDCLAATKVCGGDALACKYGCLGFGSCVAACKFDALHIGPNGAAVVDKEKCTNCGACREACPRKLIVEVPYSKKVFVNCSNKVSIDEVQEYTPVEEPTVWERISGGFIGSVKGLGNGLLDLLVWVLAKSPYLVILGGVTAGVVVLIKKRKVRRAAKKAAKQNPTEESK